MRNILYRGDNFSEIAVVLFQSVYLCRTKNDNLPLQMTGGE
jgi:hypothetical protein